MSYSLNLSSDTITLNKTKHTIKKVMIHSQVWITEFFEEPFEAEKWRISLSPKPVSKPATVVSNNLTVGCCRNQQRNLN